MRFTETDVEGARIVELERLEDSRGYFARVWCAREFAEEGLATEFVQGNLAYTERAGTLRGLHYQEAPHEEAKLFRCTRGAMFDVVADVRAGSPSYGAWAGVELTPENRKALYVPEGCAHGYQTLTDGTEAHYLVSTFYASDAERGVRYDDPTLGIDWPMEIAEISEKDASLPRLGGDV